MFVAVSRFEIHIPGERSLKGKRSVVTGMKERLRARFRAAVSEVGNQELWQRAVLGAALVGTSPEALHAGLAAMRRMIEENPRCQLLSWEGRVSAFEDGHLSARRNSAHPGENRIGADDARRALPTPAGEHAPAEPEWYETEPDDETFGGDWNRFREQAKTDSEDDGDARAEDEDPSPKS